MNSTHGAAPARGITEGIITDVRRWLRRWGFYAGVPREVLDDALSDALLWAHDKPLPKDDDGKVGVLFATARRISALTQAREVPREPLPLIEDLDEDDSDIVVSPYMESSLEEAAVYHTALSLLAPGWREPLVKAAYSHAVGEHGWQMEVARDYGLSFQNLRKELQYFRARLRKHLGLPDDAPWTEIKHALWRLQ